jgi:hypothetical protein
VIGADGAQLRQAGTLVPGNGSAPLPSTYVVIARRDTPGAMLQLALLWANDARAVLLALDAGTAPCSSGQRTSARSTRTRMIRRGAAGAASQQRRR